MPRFGRIASGLGLALAGLAAAAVPAAAAAPARPFATLATPGAETALVAGETATLDWTPGPELARARYVEEWEAFLSVDGGRHYALRITPHLDRDLHRIRFRVPDLPTADARILLRFGDERRETAVELPQRFSIVRTPGAAPHLAAAPPAASLRAGEPARPGEEGVERWIEGSRRGEDLREVEATPPPGVEGVTDPAAERGALAATAPQRASNALPSPQVAARADALPPTASLRDLQRAAPRAVDVLLLSRRRNE